MSSASGVERGTSLLELLVALALLGALSLPLIAMLMHAREVSARTSDAEDRVQKELRLRHILREVMMDLDSHRLEIPPVVHRGRIGENRSSDGPEAESDAISGLRLKSDLVMTFTPISSVLGPRGTAEGTLCAVLEHAGRSYRQLLGISPSGSLAEWRVTGGIGKGRCAAVMLASSYSHVLPTAAHREAPLVLIPIAEEYTIYRDESGTLRRISHEGSTDTSNQPIMTDAPAMRFELHRVFGGATFELETAIRWNDEPPANVSASHLIAREAPWNVALGMVSR